MMRQAGFLTAVFWFVMAGAALAQDVRPAAYNDQLNKMFEAGQYAEAVPIAERYASETKAKYGDQSLEYAAAITWLSGFYHLRGRYAEADPLMRTVLAIRERLLGPDHDEVGNILNNLGENEKALRKYDEALTHLQRALVIREKVHGPVHRDVATTLNNLAGVYQSKGERAKAEPLMRRTTEIFEKVLGPSHHDVAVSLNNLAALYYDRGQYPEAERVQQRALSIFEATSLSEHPSAAIALGSLAKIQEVQGRLQEAEPLYRRALAVAERTMGPSHVEVIQMRANLGGLYKALGRRAEARELLEGALVSTEQVLGPKHSGLAYHLTQLGDLERLEGRCEAAERLFQRAESLGAQGIVEVPVFFATDRRQDTTGPSIAFGGERSPHMAFGTAIVTLSAASEPDAGPSKLGKAKITEVQRLAMHCIELKDGSRVIEASARRMAGARKYPDQVLIYVHGYKVSFESAVRRAAQIAFDLKFDGSVFLFSWPARGQFIDYLTDSDTVDSAADHLEEFLLKIADLQPSKIHFIAHSMGNMVMLKALKEAAENPKLSRIIGEVIHAAPDVDPQRFVQLVGAIKKNTGNFTLYASRSDWALWLSSALRSLPRAGYFTDEPLIAPGFDTLDVTQPGQSWYDLFSMNHDIYASNATLVGDMRNLIEKGLRPPDARTPEFEAVTGRQGVYWRFRTQ